MSRWILTGEWPGAAPRVPLPRNSIVLGAPGRHLVPSLAAECSTGRDSLLAVDSPPTAAQPPDRSPQRALDAEGLHKGGRSFARAVVARPLTIRSGSDTMWLGVVRQRLGGAGPVGYSLFWLGRTPSHGGPRNRKASEKAANAGRNVCTGRHSAGRPVGERSGGATVPSPAGPPSPALH